MRKFAILLLCLLVLGCGRDSMPGLSPLAVEFGGSTTDDAVSFGYLPILRLADHRQQSMSAWIYYDADESGNFHRIVSTRGGDTLVGWTVRVTNVSGADVYLIFDAAMWSGTAGLFYVAPEAFSPDAWTHIVVTYDSSSTSNEPVFYVNGTAKTTSTTTSPSGSFVDGGSTVIIGNMSTAAVWYNQAFDGKIFDPRIYNAILTQAEVTALYNSGTASMSAGTKTNLVFQPFAVRDENLADYTNQTLTGDLKLFDAQFLAVGTPSGAPIGRAAP